jgi:ATP-dependent DNA helicase RecQ
VSDDRSIRELARRRFHFADLRPGQADAVSALVGGRDCLAVMPTGGGKSAIYQLAGLVLDGPTVVVSPLVALQRDQVEAIEDEGLGSAAAVNSSVRASERREALDEVETGELEFLFLAPEQFGNEEIHERLEAARPSLFVVDEAHCISEWGHDFRPEYLRLGAVVEELGHPIVLALTATASPLVRAEIVERLGLREPLVVVRGFDRPNIWLGVETFFDERAKHEALLERVHDAAKPGIVYVATRRRAEELAAELDGDELSVRPYHAGMRGAERTDVQEAFMADEVDVVVATVAFGMGVDKPNVRFVFHLEITDSVDSYYQEVGRAGRDGERATAILFYRPEDVGLRRFFAGSGRVDAAEVEQVADALARRDGALDPRALAAETGLSQTKVHAALSRLEEAGTVEFAPTGDVEARGATPAQAARDAAVAQEHHREFERSRIEMIRGYAELRDCRRRYLLNYFGEERTEPCGFCDNCEAGVVSAGEEAGEPFPLQARVAHAKWGKGTVARYEGDKMVVLFDEVGYKTLAIDLVCRGGLLVSAADE